MNHNLKNLCNHFEHSYVLSIPRATERQQNMKQQFDGCDLEFLMGMDSKNETKEDLIRKGVYDEVKAMRNDSHKRALSLGDIACSWGQAQIYKAVLENKYKNALIFEDDAIVDVNTIHLIEKMLEAIPEDADLIYWGWEIMITPKRFLPFRKLYHHAKLELAKFLLSRNGFSLYCFSVTDHTMVKNIYAKPYNEYFMEAGAHYCTHAYSVTAKCCEILLNMQTPVSFAADHLLINAILHKRIKAYIAYPRLFIQDYQSVNPTLPQYTERYYIQPKNTTFSEGKSGVE